MGETRKLIRSYEALAGAVPDGRHELADFARAAGATAEELQAIKLAVSEALTNVVLHAYAAAGGHVHVSAAIAGDELWILVGDDGVGLHAGGRESPGLGIGLALIADLTDSFAVVNRSSGGTEVRMRFNLQRSRGDRGGQAVCRPADSAARPASSIFSTTR